MKRITTLLGALLLVLCFGAGQAVAADGGGAAQTAGQSAPSGQSADGAGGAYQAGPSNSASFDSRAQPRQRWGRVAVEHDDCGRHCGKRNTTSQSTSQSQAGGYRFRLDPDRRPGGPEHAGRERGRNLRCSSRRPTTRQSIRVLSPGNGGDVTQSNSATAGAAALNGNETDQTVDQTQSGGAAPSYADEKKPDDKSGSGSD